MSSPSVGVRELLHAQLDALLKEIFQQKLQERIAKKEPTQEAASCPS